MTAMDDLGRLALWAWHAIAQPVLARGGWAARATTAACITTAAALLQALRIGCAKPLELLGKKKLDELIARSDEEIEKAKAGANRRRLAQVEEAKLAAQRQDYAIREAAILKARAEEACNAAQASKLLAEADQIRMAAEDARMRAQTEALDRLLDALRKMRQRGGDIVFDAAQLLTILRLSDLPTARNDHEQDTAAD